MTGHDADKRSMSLHIGKKQSVMLLCLIVLIEGYVTISAEILFIRQLLAFVGGSIIVTSLIIGVFLLFLAAGYHCGGRIKKNFRGVLQRNLNIATMFFGIGISYPLVGFIFYVCIHFFHLGLLAYLSIYLVLITAPLVFVLAYTVPVVMDMLKVNQSAGSLGGKMLALSTIGSFLGATLTSLISLHYFGVAWSITFSSALLALMAILLAKPGYPRVFQMIFSVVLIACVYLINVTYEHTNFNLTDNYANYNVSEIHHIKYLTINNSHSSALTQNHTPYAYIQLVQKILFSKHGRDFHHKNILIIGAGGFTLTAKGTHQNKVTYVDIDPNIKAVVEKHFLKHIKGHFVGADARVFLEHSQKKYSAILSDAYSNISTVPSYLMTANYFELLRAHLVNGGLAIFNIIANPSFKDAFSQHIDNTIRAVFSHCTAQPLSYAASPTNMVYVCVKQKTSYHPVIYTDDLNNVTRDLFLSVH
jgi:spermidine synthase